MIKWQKKSESEEDEEIVKFMKKTDPDRFKWESGDILIAEGEAHGLHT